MKNLITLFLLILITTSCGTYHPQSKAPTFVKVLGITHEGDTILIDVNSLRPKVYNNYYYDNGYRPHYSRYNPPIIIRPHSNQSNRPNIPNTYNNNTNINTKPVITPNKPNKNGKTNR